MPRSTMCCNTLKKNGIRLVGEGEEVADLTATFREHFIMTDTE